MAPVKGYSDHRAIDQLIADEIIDQEFAADVLAGDFKNPLFSAQRCQLLRQVPATLNATWRAALIRNLLGSAEPAAAVLLDHLTSVEKTLDFHQQSAAQYIGEVRTTFASKQGLENWMKVLQANRDQVLQAAIPQNPLGQILEPGFRVIFPEAK